jgi:NAD+ synthase
MAALVAQYPNVQAVRVDLTAVYDALTAALPEGEDRSNGLALANSRARLRMTTLYALAAERGALVAGTGNKVEDFGVGFYTKYGDGGVDVSPIADLVKTEVFALAAELGVSNEIQSAAPTDGLWGDDRTDEDQLGATYPELEWAMANEGEDGSSWSAREREVMEIFQRLNRANQHKMQPIPVCIIPDALRL